MATSDKNPSPLAKLKSKPVEEADSASPKQVSSDDELADDVSEDKQTAKPKQTRKGKRKVKPGKKTKEKTTSEIDEPNFKIHFLRVRLRNIGQRKKTVRTITTTTRKPKQARKSIRPFSESQENKKYQCDLCGKGFERPFRLARHKNQVHGIPMPPKRQLTHGDHQCEMCEKYFSNSCHVRRHQKRVHGIEPKYKWGKLRDADEDSSNKHPCSTCGKNFTSLQHLRRHEKNIHNIEPTFVRGRKSLKCAECSSSFPSNRTYAEHFKQEHPDIVLKSENLTFDSQEDFDKWKTDLERETVAMFIKTHRYQPSPTCTVRDYNCHRSGSYRGEGKGKRRIKSVGSNKIGCYCPARIHAKTTQTPNNGVTIEVTFHSTHVGHKCEPDRVRLSKPEKEVISEQLQAGIPINRVLQNLSAEPNPSKRLAITKAQDLRNIAASFGIDRSLFRSQKRERKKRKKNTENTEQYTELMELMNDHVSDHVSNHVNDHDDGPNEPEDNNFDGYDNDVASSPTPSEPNFKEEARSAILAFIPELEKYTSEQQYKEIIHTLCVLKHKCEAMEASARYVIPPTPTSYVTPSVPANYVTPSAPTRYVTPPEPTRYVTPSDPTRYVTPSTPMRYVTPCTSARYMTPPSQVRYATPSSPSRYLPPLAPTRYAIPTTSTRYVSPPTTARYVTPPSGFPPCSNYSIQPL